MPSFFRSPKDESSSSSEEEEDSTSSGDSRNELEAQRSTELARVRTLDSSSQEEVTNTLTSSSERITVNRPRQDVVVHSLLEQMCIEKAVNHFNYEANVRQGISTHWYTADDPEVKEYAATQYQSMAGMLADGGFIPDGYDASRNRELQDKYAKGLQMLWDQEPKPLLPSSGAELVQQVDHLSVAPTHATLLSFSHIVEPTIQSLPAVLQSLVSHPAVHPSQYRRDFVEVKMVGKGGYGKVFAVRKRLDGSHYAVKKIPLSASSIQKLHERAEAELDSLLIELRTLAKMNHPNIVRYYNGWLELSESELQIGESPIDTCENEQNQPRLLEFPGFAVTGETDLFTSSSLGGSTEEINMRSKSQNRGPGVTLYLQMEFLPGTLTDFLKHHCFHVFMALQLLLAILDGVQYLHRQGVVHRDLKPDNIFLSVHNTAVTGCVNLWDCQDCPEQRIPFEFHQIRPQIGDFGLVTDMARGDSNESLSSTALAKVVGTELYRPHGPCKASEKLDVFALGIILFELLWKFGTKMERYDVLTKLRNGDLPHDFTDACGESAARLIRGMICAEEERLTCAQVRAKTEEMLGTMQQGSSGEVTPSAMARSLT